MDELKKLLGQVFGACRKAKETDLRIIKGKKKDKENP